MVDLQKYSEKEVYAAIKVVEEILDLEHFYLNIGWDEEFEENAFCLKDDWGANLGGIESEYFSCLGNVIGRLENYHYDSLYNDYNERIGYEKIPRDDYDRKLLIFLESDYCADLLMDIDVETYQMYRNKTLDEIGLNDGELIQYMFVDLGNNTKFDNVGYVIDKAIALNILETESAYFHFEHDGAFYLSEYDAPFESNEEFKEEVLKSLAEGVTLKHDDCYWQNFNLYSTVISSEFGQIQEDMQDIGLYDKDGNWDFYLSKYELEYLGLGDELEKYLKLDISGLSNNELKNIVDLIDKIDNMCESEISEEVCEYIDNNQEVFDAIEAEVIRLLPEAINKYGITTDANVEDCLYNCDALYMEAICNVLGDKVIPVKCGYGMIEMNQKDLDSVLVVGERTFELVDEIPNGYCFWNIGKNMTDGYLPLCRLKTIQHFDGGREIETDTLKAIKLEGAQTVLKAVSEGFDTVEKLEKFVARNTGKNLSERQQEKFDKAVAALDALQPLLQEKSLSSVIQNATQRSQGQYIDNNKFDVEFEKE